MPKFDVIEIFNRLAGFEYELLKYIYRTQGEASAPINFYAAAEALSASKDDIRRAFKRLVDADILIVDGEAFKINNTTLKN